MTLTSKHSISNPLFLDSDLSQEIRRKQLHKRSQSEHEWVSLDCILNPHIYGASFKPLFDLDLDENVLHRLLTLPKQLQHAFGFIQNDRELKAHFLLHKYYRVADKGAVEEEIFYSESIKALDVDFGLVEVATIGPKLATLDNIYEIADNSVKDSKPFFNMETNDDEIVEPIQIVSNLNQLNDDFVPSTIHNSCILLKESGRIMEKANRVIEKKEKHHYSFAVQNNLSRKLASLIVSVVFHGTFIGEEYRPGYLSASLFSIGENLEKESVGEAKHSLQVLNCTKNLGRLIIEYEPRFHKGALNFQIAVAGLSHCQYSLVVSGKVVVATKNYFISEMKRLLHHRQEVIKQEEIIDEIDLDVRILGRRVVLLQNLSKEMECKMMELENAIYLAEYEFESGSLNLEIDNSLGTESALYSEKQKRIEVSKNYNNIWCKL